MDDRRCPHCGNALPTRASLCPCGFDSTEVPPPAIVRSASSQVSQAVAPAGPVRQEAKIVSIANRGSRVEDGLTQPNEAMLMGCPTCDARISKRAHRCPKCSSAPYACCQICANRILVNAIPCPECGDPCPFET